MDTFMYDDSSSDSTNTSQENVADTVQPDQVSLSFYSLLTKSAFEKLCKNSTPTKGQIMDLALGDLKNVPDLSEIHTIGDLVCFLNRYDYIKKLFDTQPTICHADDHHQHHQHLPDCDYYKQTNSEMILDDF